MKYLIFVICALLVRPAYADTLHGGVEVYRDELSRLAVGDPFSDSSLPRDFSSDFIQIPENLDGLWKIYDRVYMPENNPATAVHNAMRQELILGGYRDRKGRDWAKFDSPTIEASNNMGDVMYSIVYRSDFRPQAGGIYCTLDEFDIHTAHGMITSLDRFTARELITAPIKDLPRLVLSDVRNDAPTTKINRIAAKLSPAPAPLFATLQTFNDFLTNHGLSKLVPRP